MRETGKPEQEAMSMEVFSCCRFFGILCKESSKMASRQKN
jgi:hypothetical protein